MDRTPDAVRDLAGKGFTRPQIMALLGLSKAQVDACCRYHGIVTARAPYHRAMANPPQEPKAEPQSKGRPKPPPMHPYREPVEETSVFERARDVLKRHGVTGAHMKDMTLPEIVTAANRIRRRLCVKQEGPEKWRC